MTYCYLHPRIQTAQGEYAVIPETLFQIMFSLEIKWDIKAAHDYMSNPLF